MNNNIFNADTENTGKIAIALLIPNEDDSKLDFKKI